MKVMSILLLVIMIQAGHVSAKSLFADDTYSSLVGDNRSHKKDQVLTVLIYETATSSSSTGTETSRSSAVGLAVTGTNTQHTADLGINTDFDGGGDMARSGKFVASVSVNITDVFENGDVYIKGEQLLEFNNEKQQIFVEGRVRVDDISETNTVISTRIADAKIRYLGEGLLSERERPGIITQLLNWLF